MISKREDIYQAVFDVLKKAPSLTTASRRFRPFPQIKANETPALMTLQKGEQLIATHNMATPYVWELLLWVVVYIMSSPTDPNYVPSTPLNQILDYIEQTFPVAQQATPGRPATAVGRNTLGIPGVYEACIDGRTEFDEGIIAPNTYAAVPLKIIAV